MVMRETDKLCYHPNYPPYNPMTGEKSQPAKIFSCECGGNTVCPVCKFGSGMLPCKCDAGAGGVGGEAMTDKCPGCGSPVRTVEGKGTDCETTIYTCGTGEDSGYYGRQCWANQCMAKEDQIAQYAELLREAGEVVGYINTVKSMMDTIHPDGLPAKYRQAYEGILFMAPKAQALAPTIRAALEEKP